VEEERNEGDPSFLDNNLNSREKTGDTLHDSYPSTKNNDSTLRERGGEVGRTYSTTPVSKRLNPPGEVRWSIITERWGKFIPNGYDMANQKGPIKYEFEDLRYAFAVVWARERLGWREPLGCWAFKKEWHCQR